MNSPSLDHWKRHAQQWSLVRAPLRPSSEDIIFTRAAVAEWLRNTPRMDPTVLVLGVTQELCSLRVHGEGRMIAVDNSADMIRALWPPDAGPRAEVICANWHGIPLEKATIDLVLADGSFSALPFPTGYFDLCAELRRLLRPRGQCVIRCFAQSEKRETVEDVFADLSGGLIGNFHVLKWRLAMALQLEAEAGVAVGSVWSALHATWPRLDLLARRFGWPEVEVQTIEAYRHGETRYTFPRLAQYLRLFPEAGFSVVKVATPTYELGERCPTLVLERP
jgi:SAM-dependent methyltransferase